MRKITLLLCITIICAVSCSKDDNGSSSSDKIIGTWGLYKFVDLTDNYTENYDMNDLENQITFKENGILEYYETDYHGNLVNTIIESWMHVEGTRYSTTYDRNEIQFYIEFDSNNEMRMRQYDIIDDGFEEFTEWAYYRRLE